MKLKITCSVVALIASHWLPVANAAVRSDDGLDNTAAAQAQANRTSALLTEQNYKLSQATVVRVLQNNEPGKASVQYVELPRDAEFVVIDQKQTASGTLVRIGLDVLASEEIPSDMWVAESDLIRGGADLVDLQSVALGAQDFTDQVAQLEDENNDFYEIRNSSNGRTHRKRGTGGRRGGMTYCFRIVKQDLVKHGTCSHYPSGANARDGYKILQAECGMHPVPYSSHLPVGAVCSSAGTGHHRCGGTSCGHISYNTGHGWTIVGGKLGRQPFIGKPKGCLVP